LAESVRGRIGPRLGDAIIKPIQSGYVDGRSYMMLPWCREFSSWRAIRVMQRMVLVRPLLKWLHEVAATAAVPDYPFGNAGESFSGVLAHLLNQKFVDDDIKIVIRKSMDRLNSGKWNPRHAVDHNDFYLGNVMLPARMNHHTRPRYPFVLIDWAGANPQGYGIYDLIRLALALKLSVKALRRELVTHSTALQCDPSDTSGHLLAAFGRLHQHLECFPEARYIQTFRNCWAAFRRALPEGTN